MIYCDLNDTLINFLVKKKVEVIQRIIIKINIFI